MKFSVIAVLCLTSLASAADIRTYWTKGCNGGHLAYPGISARQCASALRTEPDVRGARSVQYASMPRGAKVFAYQQTRPNNICGSLTKQATIGASGKLCMGPKIDLQYAGVSWARPARTAGISSAGNQTADETCTETVQPSQLILDDGHMYDLTKLSDDQVLDLVALAQNGTASGALSSEYTAVETEKDGVASRLQEMQE